MAITSSEAAPFHTGIQQSYGYTPPTATDLRKEAKRMEKQERRALVAAKARKREARAKVERRRIALDALVRVAQDDYRGFPAVEAAKVLLAESV